MEERIGKRINIERIDEALGTDPDTISTGCPYCLVMLGDAVSAKKSSGEAKETLEVVDVAQLLARSVAAQPAAVAASGNGHAPPDAADDAAPVSDAGPAAPGEPPESPTGSAG